MDQSNISVLHDLIKRKDYKKVYSVLTDEIENTFSTHIAGYTPQTALMDIDTNVRPIVSAYRTIFNDEEQNIEQVIKRLMSFYPRMIDYFKD